MRKFKLIALFLLMQLSVQAQMVVQLPDSLVGKTYLEQKLKDLESRLNLGVVVPPVVVPDSGIANCKAGPHLQEIKNVTTTSLQALFHGDEVYHIAWEIKRFNVVVRSGKFSPENNIPTISYSALEAGAYTITFRGINCIGSSSMEFQVIKPTSEVVPEIPADKNWTTKVITSGLADHMDISISGEVGNLIINDLSAYPLPDGHDYLYMVNADIIRQTTPLRNYQYQSNAPIRIWKALIRSDIDNLNHWSNTEQSDYYSPNAAATFSYNTSIAYYTAVFNSAKNQDRGFLNHIPQSYDPSTQFYQWGDVGADITLPADHVFIMRKGKWSLDQIRRKGVSHFSNYDLPWNTSLAEVEKLKSEGITYNDVPKENTFFQLSYSGKDNWVGGYNTGWWPNGPLSKPEAEKYANQVDIGNIVWIGETEEGSSYMPNSEPMWGHFYKKVRERYENYWSKRGKQYYIAHNYYSLWPAEYNLQSTTSNEAKKLLTLSADQLPKTSYSPGGTLSSTNLILEAVYLGAPDIQNGSVFETIFRLKLFANMGYYGGVFLAGQHEWRPNNLEKYQYPDGILYSHVKMPLDPNVQIGYGFLAHVFGRLYTEWGTPGRQQQPRLWSKDWTSGVWFPSSSKNVDWFSPSSSISFPYLANTDTFGGFNGSQDLSQFSQALFVNTYGIVEGGKDQYLKFRLDGQSWYIPENNSVNDIINAYYNKHGVVHSRSKDGKTAWFYLNPFADNTARKLEVMLPDGQIITKTVAGNGIHVTI